jgi:hypothetical protein
MAGQSALLPIGKARSQAKGAGCELGCSNGGSQPRVPTEGKTLGSSQKGYPESAGTVSPKKAKQMY